MAKQRKEGTDDQHRIISDSLGQIQQYYRQFGRGLTIITPDSTGKEMKEMGFIPLDRWDEFAPRLSPEMAEDSYTRQRVETYNVAEEVVVLMLKPSGGAELISQPLPFADGFACSFMLSLHEHSPATGNIEIKRTQVALSVSTNDSGAALVVNDLPAEMGNSIEFQAHALTGEKEKGTLRQATAHPVFQALTRKDKKESVNYLKTIFEAADWLKPGILNPIDSSRIHPTPPDGERWSGYFVNLLVPKDRDEPSVSIHFLQRHRTDVPALDAKMLVSIIRDMFRFATDPSFKASSN